MASGDNLALDFDSSLVNQDPKSYPFGSGNTAGVPAPVQLDPDGIDAYGGESFRTGFTPRLRWDVTLYEEADYDYQHYVILEFYREDPFSWQHHGAHLEIDLTVEHGKSPLTYYFTLDGEQRHPPYNQVYSAPRAYVPPFRYNQVCFEFDENDDWQLSVGFAQSETAPIELTTDRLVTNNVVSIDREPTGATVLSSHNAINLTSTSTTLSPYETGRSWDNELEFRFDDGIGFSDNLDLYTDGALTNGGIASASLVLADREIPLDRSNTADFDLQSQTTQVSKDFDIKTHILDDHLSGKNTRFEILLCPEDENPPLVDGVSEPHDFEFSGSFYGFGCGEISLSFYHGAEVKYQFDKTVYFEDVDPDHGADAVVDLSVTAHMGSNNYSGQYSDCSFSIFPFAELDGDAYSGEDTSVDLLTIQIMYDVDTYSGQTLEIDVTTKLAPAFTAFADHGSYGELELYDFPIMYVDGTSHGADAIADIEIAPSSPVLVDVYGGEYADSFLLIYRVFDPTFIHGADATADMDVKPSGPIGDLNPIHGSHVSTDLAYTPTVDSDAEHGSYGELDIATTYALDADGYDGATADADFTRVEAPMPEPVATHGSYGDAEMVTTKALFPRAYAGSSSDSDLTIFAAQETGVTYDHGSVMELDSLEETDFNFFSYHGSTQEDFNLQVTVNFPLDIIGFGSYAEGDGVSRAPALDMDIYHGANGVQSGFTVPQGEAMLINAYTGAHMAGEVEQPIYTRFPLHPIVASQNLRDGLGGVGGINHCYLSEADLDPYHRDNVNRLGYDPLGIDDRLDIIFDDIGDDPWTTCNSGGMKFDLEFQTNPRFEVEFNFGADAMAYFPLKILPLFAADVPLPRLYEYEYHAVFVQETFTLEGIEYQTTGAVWDHPDDFVAFYEAYFSAELTPTAFAPFFGGASANADFVVPVYGWKHGQKPYQFGSYAQFAFEPVDYTRFCKGYIVPNGNAVVFEYAAEDEIDCTIFVAGYGMEMSTVTLQTEQSFQVTYSDGSNTSADLILQKLWTLYARGGENMYAQPYAEARPEADARHGSSVWIEFYVPPILAEIGDVMLIDTIVVPGPAVRWQTETQCLPNDFKPTTPDGDIDVIAMQPNEHGVVPYPLVPVEGKPYFANLLAHCIAYDKSIEGDEE